MTNITSPQPVSKIRVFCFYSLYVCSIVLWSIASVVIWPFFPFKMRFYIILYSWAKFVISWLKFTCQIDYKIMGLENVPKIPSVVVSNHQSPLETFLLQTIFTPQSTVIKRELLYIPFFGWGFAALKPIAINRARREIAMQQLIRIGKTRLENGMWVLIFPEGTRVSVHRRDQRFSRGAAALAIASGRQVIPVAHNAGFFWPAHQFKKYKGTVDVVIGEPIDIDGLSSEELTLKIRLWTLEQMDKLHINNF